jgi:hypothetical protein
MFAGLSGMLIFVIGLLLGQQSNGSKFDKYLRPYSVTAMQMVMIDVNMELIRNHSDVATIYYDPACSCLAGSEIVPPDAMKRPFEELRHRLLADTVYPIILLKGQFPELSQEQLNRNFKMHFRKFTGTEYVTFAEYANGAIVFK